MHSAQLRQRAEALARSRRGLTAAGSQVRPRALSAPAASKHVSSQQWRRGRSVAQRSGLGGGRSWAWLPNATPVLAPVDPDRQRTQAKVLHGRLASR